MTARYILEAVLIELNKHNAPALKLFEFNYYVNKAITQVINKIYNWYDINQQTTDDLYALETIAELTPEKCAGDAYEVYLPLDYLHLLNCICVYKVNKTKDCYEAGTQVEIPATRLTADSWGSIMTDIYNRPSCNKPYYYIHNTTKPSNKGVRVEIRGGKSFELETVKIGYVKIPQVVIVTQEQIDLIEDTSQIMEFPDYINQEIINELVHLVMERVNDPRLNNNLQITQTIARPTQQQQR